MDSTQSPHAKKIAVSPSYTLDKLSTGRLEDKIDVFEDQVRGWVFDHARALNDPSYTGREHSGLAVLMLACSYFESIASFIKGESSNKRSREFFRAGLLEVFPSIRAVAQAEDPARWEDVLKDMADIFYDDLRCSLFHEAMFRGKILIHPGMPLSLIVNQNNHEVGTITINPAQFLEVVEAHFAQYISKLRDPQQAELRSNFESEFDRRASRPAAVIPTD